MKKLHERMKRETIAIHAGYDGDPTTKAVAVPIYQTVAFEFDSAEHGAALFNLEVQGNIYTRIGNPTNTVLEKRVAALEGGVDGLSVSSGMAAIEYSLINIAEAGNNIVSTPQLYGATYTLLAHIFPKRGISSRFAATDRPEDIEKLIDENTRAVYCESVGNPAGNVADIEGLAQVAHKHGVPLVVDNTVATPILLRPIEYGADVVVHSMTKFIGGGGTSIGGMIVDGGKFPWRQYPKKFYMLNVPEVAYHGVVYVDHFGDAAFVARCRTVCQRNTGATLSPFNGFLVLAGNSDASPPRRAPRGECAQGRGISARSSHGRLGELRRLSRQSALSDGASIFGLELLLAADLRGERRLRGRQEVLQRFPPVQAHGEHGRCQIVVVSPGVDHPPATDSRGTGESRSYSGDDSTQRGDRAYRRYSRGSGSGAGKRDGRRKFRSRARIVGAGGVTCH